MSRTPAGPGASAATIPAPRAPQRSPEAHPTGTVTFPERLAELVARAEAMSLDEAVAPGRSIGGAEADGATRRRPD